MDKRKKIIIGIISAVILVLIILIIWLLWKRPGGIFNPPVTNTNVGLQIPAGLPSSSAPIPKEPLGPVKDAKIEANMKAIASTFAERWGSYSNEGNFSNVETMGNLITIKMRAYLNSLKVQPNTASSTQQVYYGITTKALSVVIKDYDETIGQANVVVTTQRQEAKVNTVNLSTYYQDLNIKLVKSNNIWQVDFAEWGARK